MRREEGEEAKRTKEGEAGGRLPPTARRRVRRGRVGCNEYGQRLYNEQRRRRRERKCPFSDDSPSFAAHCGLGARRGFLLASLSSPRTYESRRKG